MKGWLVLTGALLGCAAGSAADEEDAAVDATPLPELGVEMPVEPGDCSAHDFRGQVYDCTTLPLCDEAFELRLACCDCDPALCNVPPSCADPGPFADTALPTLTRACGGATCHGGLPEDPARFRFANHPDRTPEDVEASRLAAEAQLDPANPEQSPLLQRPLGGGGHQLVLRADHPDYLPLKAWGVARAAEL